MDIQHIVNSLYSKKYFHSYEIKKGLSIVISPREHYLLTKNRTKNFSSIETLLKEETQSLENFTDISKDKLELVISLINDRYSKEL